MLFILLKAALCFSQASQQQDTIKMICREWKFKEAYSDNMDNNSQELKDFIKYTRLLFKSNMTYIEKDDTLAESGKWKYNSSKKEIILEDSDGFKVIMKIIYLSPSMLKFEGTVPETNVSTSGSLVPSG